MAVACDNQANLAPEESVVVLPGGPVALEDTQFGVYYGNIKNDGAGLFSIVLSDARCYQDELGKPYMDSEGDMLVLNFRTRLLGDDESIEMPSGEYQLSAEPLEGTIDVSTSYVTRLVGNIQSRWDMQSGTVKVERDESGEYQISTNDLIISKGAVTDTVEYVFNSPLSLSDYMVLAPAMTSGDDDIIDMPFPDVTCVYHGNLFGSGAGNFVMTLSTKGFLDDVDMELPGIYVVMNFFSKLFTGNTAPYIEEGKYSVSTATSSSSLFQRWSLLPGLLMDTSPFGSYIGQLTKDGKSILEYITSGVVEISYDDEAETSSVYAKMCTMTYSFKTSSRSISGVWTGEILVDNQSETGASSEPLSTLEDDVECDMKNCSKGTLGLVEVLHRENVIDAKDYDIAEAWQLWIEPDSHAPDGDVMVMEFVLPLGSQGEFAPELNKEYTYTMQPSLAITDEWYELYVSRMGRPHDELFDPQYAMEQPGWADFLEGYDRCNGRRGFTYAGGFRGNWYMHYEEGRFYVMDQHAPAINGWVKVKRTGDNIYDFQWEFCDDYPGTPNMITGSMTGCKVVKL